MIYDHATTISFAMNATTAIITTSLAMNAIIVNLLKFLILTFLILIYIVELRCAVIFPTANITGFRRNYRFLNKTNQISQFNRNLTIYKPKQFGILTRQKFVSDNIVGLCALKNCQQNDLTVQKNRELLKIRQRNSTSNKLPNDSNTLPLHGMKSGK